MSKRALRRHHRARLKSRTRKILLNSYLFSIFNPGWTKDLEYRVNIRWNNMQMCSCICCGNPRHRYGRNFKTMQELREVERENCDWLELKEKKGS